MQQITDIAYRLICIGRNDYRYRYIGFAEMGYFISADTDMPTLIKVQVTIDWLRKIDVNDIGALKGSNYMTLSIVTDLD